MAAACRAAAAATICEQSNQTLSSKSRKVHKADREKLRRDKLNEQFTELASVLDAKHDKASILGESLQVVKELRNEITRLKTERGTLFEESKDLNRERDDLEEEKTSLQKETEELSFRLQECIRASLTFVTTAANQTDDQHTRLNTIPSSVPADSHYPPQGAAESLSNPFVYLARPSPAATTVERPCARYASVDAVPDFLSKVQSNPGFQPATAAKASVPQSVLADQLEDEDNDIQLHLGQPRTLRHHDSVQADEVDTDLQLKVPVPVSEPAHGGGL